MKTRKVKWEKVGEIGVDAGICWIGDPSYVVAKDSGHVFSSWSEFCAKLDMLGHHTTTRGATAFPYRDGRPGLGIVVSTRAGDGLYEVFVEHDANGRVRQAKVVFM